MGIEGFQDTWHSTTGKKKSIHHHRGIPLFSVCRPTPRSQSKKSYGAYHFPGKAREKGIHHRSGKNQEWPRQTKPKKGQFMNFSQGHSGTKIQCESLSGRHRGIASLVFSHRGVASQRISAARTRIARILHRIASLFCV